MVGIFGASVVLVIGGRSVVLSRINTQESFVVIFLGMSRWHPQKNCKV